MIQPNKSSPSTDNSVRAARVGPRAAFVTCTAVPELDPDDRLLRDALVGRGSRIDVVAWDDPAVDWAGYDLVVLRSTWDYPPRRAEFVAWADSVPRLANPGAVVAWNTDKRYLAELTEAGVPVVPTRWLGPDQPVEVGAHGEFVVKPSVGAGSVDTGRYDLADPVQRDLAVELVGRLHASGRVAMVQPYLAAVDSYGETALLYFDGEYSHAIRKDALLTGPDPGVEGLYREERITPRVPTPAEYALAERVLDVLPFDRRSLLYARVDLVPDESGRPVLLELELTEPSLFLGTAPDAVDRLADAIERRLTRSRS